MYQKKLIESALPLEVINEACRTDKDRKTGTIRNLHKWFAPMPVPALRALIFASIVDDPEDEADRARLLELIEKLVASGVEDPDPALLAEATRALERGSNGTTPIVVDPFCGGGSTLVEAQRLGLHSRGSDLNPVPILISKVLTELPPSVLGHKPLHADRIDLQESRLSLDPFIKDVEYYAARVRDEAYARLSQHYPSVGSDRVVAWFWARTVPSPDPRYQTKRVPLVTNWWLSKQKGRRAFIQPTVDTQRGEVRFVIGTSGEPPAPSKDRCLLSGAPIDFAHVRAKGAAGELGVQMMALATNGAAGRGYVTPDDVQVAAAKVSESEAFVATLPLPEKAIGFRVQAYGMSSWSDLFLPRQRLALSTFAELVRTVPSQVLSDGGTPDYARAVGSVLSLAVGKLAQFNSTQCLWKIDSRNGSGKAESAKFGRNDIPMSWDFVETNPFGGSVGDWMQIVETSTRALRFVHPAGPPAVVTQGSARSIELDPANHYLVVTDPPYFDAIGYANLSDYFYPWLRHAAQDLYPELFATLATPKADELIVEPARHPTEDEARRYFREGFADTFRNLGAVAGTDYPMLIVYASKEQGGGSSSSMGAWEAMLEALIRAGLQIVATWPIHGTGSTRLRGLGSNALATYVVLVCRHRASDAQRIGRSGFLSLLRRELGPAVRVLQSAAVAPVDLAQAVIGPGMSIFTRNLAVLEADGSEMSVAHAQQLINQALAEVIDEQEADWDPETRWAVAWFEQYGFGEGPSGSADALARAKSTSIGTLERAGIVITGGSRTRLKERSELPLSYDPTLDTVPTFWEAVQHLVRYLENDGEVAAAELLARVPDQGGARELAYRLYNVSDSRGWSKEATSYNGLVVAWPEILRLGGRANAEAAGHERLTLFGEDA